MFTSVAAATGALNVISTVIGSTSSALIGRAAATSVVYAGVPSSITGWSNVTVRTDPTALAAVTTIGVVGWGRVTPTPELRLLVARPRFVRGVIIRISLFI